MMRVLLALLSTALLILPVYGQAAKDASGTWRTDGAKLLGADDVKTAVGVHPGCLLKKRSANNPVIPVGTGDRATESYVPSPIQMPNGDVWVYFKGTANTYAAKSTDKGQTFTVQNGGSPVVSGTTAPSAVYDEPADVIHLYLEKTTGADRAIGHATSSSSDPTSFSTVTDVVSESFITSQTADADVIQMAPATVIKIGATLYLYAHYQGDVNGWQGFYATSTDWTSWTWGGAITAMRHPLAATGASSDILHITDVYRLPGQIDTYYMTFIENDSADRVRLAQVASSPDGTTWSRVGSILLNPMDETTADDHLHQAAFLKSSTGDLAEVRTVSDAYLLYYSGKKDTGEFQGHLAEVYPVGADCESPTITFVPLVDERLTETSTTANNATGVTVLVDRQTIGGRIARYVAQFRNQTNGVDAKTALQWNHSDGSQSNIGNTTLTNGNNTFKFLVSDFIELPETNSGMIALETQLWTASGGTAELDTAGVVLY